MIEQALRMRDAAVRHVREAVGERVGVEVAGPDTPVPHDRADAQTLAKEDWLALESYVGRPPRAPGWVILDTASGACAHAFSECTNHEVLERVSSR